MQRAPLRRHREGLLRARPGARGGVERGGGQGGPGESAGAGAVHAQGGAARAAAAGDPDGREEGGGAAALPEHAKLGAAWRRPRAPRGGRLRGAQAVRRQPVISGSVERFWCHSLKFSF